jgi:rRNA maturation RNase YbeY
MLNKNYLDHDYATDILTFDNSYLDVLSAEIFICLPVIKENSGLHSGSFEDELNRVILHGLLHLIGYDDDTGLNTQKMREREDYYLKYLD